MEEAFLVQMNDFDGFLETQLRRMLDPVIDSRPPVRGRRQKARKPFLAVVPPELVTVRIEPVPVTVAVTSQP